MKLRFGIDAAAHHRIRETLDGLCEEPPVGRRLSYVYLDTHDLALAMRDVVLRFRRSAALGASSGTRRWKRQTIWPKGEKGSLKKLEIKRLKQRLNATFDVRIERWTWQIDNGWASVSLDDSEVSTGDSHEAFAELRIVCRRKRHDDAVSLAVSLGATHLASTKARERGFALLASGEARSPN